MRGAIGPDALAERGQQVQFRKMKMGTTQSTLSVLALSIVLISTHLGSSATSFEGALKVWYPVTLTFTGKQASETEATFRDHCLDVAFSKGGKSYRVPGYFAADGNAAETSATNGGKWRVRFAANEAGEWNYSVSFREGPDIAVPADDCREIGRRSGRRDWLIYRAACKP